MARRRARLYARTAMSLCRELSYIENIKIATNNPYLLTRNVVYRKNNMQGAYFLYFFYLNLFFGGGVWSKSIES